jgi:hypothetical protein
MRKKAYLSLFFAFSTLFLFISLVGADERTNWIAFNGTGGVFKYIMAIDEEGNILVPPTAVLSYDQLAVGYRPGNTSCFGEPNNPYETDDRSSGESDVPKPGPRGPLAGPCGLALSDNGGSINYYILTAQGSVFKFEIPKSTLVPTTALPKAILARTAESKTQDFRTLQATQHVSNPFLAMVSGNIGNDSSSGLDNIQGALRAFKFKADGTLNTKAKKISPTTGTLGKIGSISADGHMAISNQEVGNGDFDDTESCDPLDNDKAGNIFATPLGSPTPIGPGQVIGTTRPQVGAVDVSNEVTSGVRFAVFATRSSDTPDSSNGDDLILQKINSNTGVKIGGRHFLQQDVEMDMTFFQGVAIDPEGEFVIFAKRPRKSLAPAPGPSGCGFNTSTEDVFQVDNRDSLYYLAIDIATGEAVGNPKLLFSADDGGFDGASDEASNTSCNSPQHQELAFPQINGIDIMID